MLFWILRPEEGVIVLVLCVKTNAELMEMRCLKGWHSDAQPAVILRRLVSAAFRGATYVCEVGRSL